MDGFIVPNRGNSIVRSPCELLLCVTSGRSPSTNSTDCLYTCRFKSKWKLPFSTKTPLPILLMTEFSLNKEVNRFSFKTAYSKTESNHHQPMSSFGPRANQIWLCVANLYCIGTNLGHPFLTLNFHLN